MPGQKPHIMIVGGNFYGRGAEAMMFTVSNAVRQVLPNAVLCVPVIHSDEIPTYQKHGFVPVRQKSLSRFRRYSHMVRRSLGLCRYTRIGLETIGPEGITDIYRVTDAVIDISGFASSDQWGPRRAFSRWEGFRSARRAGNQVVFTPQSWGPFENRWTAMFTRWMIKEADLVFARERISYDHIMGLGGIDHEKIFFAPDIAFQFKPSPSEAGDCVLGEQGLGDRNMPIVGITPNMRIYERTQGKGADNTYVRLLVGIIHDFLEKTPCQIALIPHEIYDFRPDDRVLCRILEESIDGRGRVHSLSGLETAANLKAAIGRMEFLIASRYHSLVAALSMRVPVAVIGWSHKYDELMQAVGIDEWCVDPVRRAEQSSVEIILEAWNRREAICAAERESVPGLEAASAKALERMAEAIKRSESVG